ncbi:MAG TPA: DUF4173 domain-containing protein, partial [Syntrophomonas sp.]|nr:DUF4173 domain-containing protein [Syntrophomonas sp.]
PEAQSQKQAKKTMEVDFKDGIFALSTYILGFIFARWVLFSWQGWGVTAFTFVYCGAVSIYLLKKGVHFTRAGWFWLAVIMLTGASFSLWTNNGLEPWRSLMLFCSAVYWIISATGLTILGKTSNLILLDGFNAMIVIPFRNLGYQFKSLSFLSKHERARTRKIYPIILGLFLAIIIFAMVLPLLMQADSGGFSKITNRLFAYLNGVEKGVWETLLYGILAIPIGAYIFGLVAGSANKRGCDLFQKDNTLKNISALRVLPPATVFTLLGLLCALYIVFVGSQLPYFFLAFIGQRPEGWQVYSEYARSGFFELCGIATINLTVLIAANIMGKKHYQESTALKILNALLAILTIILIATAMSKMVMYIGAYGLSMRRLLPCVFMLFMAVICGGVIALQKWKFSITRLAVGLAVVMLCTLCLGDPDSFVARYNAERYLAGTLMSFDVDILYRSGSAGVDSALKVYDQTSDQVLRTELKEYMIAQYNEASISAGNSRDNLQQASAREKIKERIL